MNEDDSVFDPPVKCEYTEEQMIRFAETVGRATEYSHFISVESI